MRRKKQIWALVGLAAVPLGFALGRLLLIGPKPGTYLALAMLAVASLIGIAYGFREARRIVKSDAPIGN